MRVFSWLSQLRCFTFCLEVLLDDWRRSGSTSTINVRNDSSGLLSFWFLSIRVLGGGGGDVRWVNSAVGIVEVSYYMVGPVAKEVDSLSPIKGTIFLSFMVSVCLSLFMNISA